jgi:hypothetical protein
MQARDWFALAVRLAAIGFLIFALFDLFYVVAKIIGVETQSKMPISTDTFAAVFFGVVGVAGLLTAERLTKLTYGSGIGS